MSIWDQFLSGLSHAATSVRDNTHIGHVQVQRPLGYQHHAYQFGPAVVHFTGEPGAKADARVAITSRATFANGGNVERVPHPEVPLATRLQAPIRAAEVHGEGGYNLLRNNCEHKANYIATGNHESRQVTGAGLWAAVRAAARKP